MTISSKSYSISNDRKLAKYTMAITVMMTGVAAHKIRKFEEYGLCSPSRTGSKQRLYSDADIEQIRQIILLNQKGVNLPGIKVILGLKFPKSGITKAE
jgi:MerR family transcriptional regulator, glutamine synthetase repressor